MRQQDSPSRSISCSLGVVEIPPDALYESLHNNHHFVKDLV